MGVAPVGQPVGQRVGQPIGWLVGWLVDRLVGYKLGPLSRRMQIDCLRLVDLLKVLGRFRSLSLSTVPCGTFAVICLNI